MRITFTGILRKAHPILCRQLKVSRSACACPEKRVRQIRRKDEETVYLLGRVVLNPVNANPGLKVNRRITFYCVKMFFHFLNLV